MDGVTGGSIPAEIWRDFMTEATRGMQVVPFPQIDLSGFRPDPSATPNEQTEQSPGAADTPTSDVSPTDPPPPSSSLTGDPGDEDPGGSPTPPTPTATITPAVDDG
ncbi:MAG: hypothetical protein WEA10_07945 [Actinomycetota bacterium]